MSLKKYLPVGIRITSLFCSLLTVCSQALGYGYDSGYGSNDEATHLLSIGGGVSSPSMTSGLIGENPAGFMYNNQTRFLGELGWTNSQLSPLGAGGLMFFGNGQVGGGLGVQNFTGQGDTAGDLTLLVFGIGSEIPNLNIAFGATGSYVLSNNGVNNGMGSGGNWNTDLGILFNPRGDIRGGITAYEVIGGVQAIGAGIAADANSYATFSLDGTSSTLGHSKVLKPALGLHMSDFQIAFGYGIHLDDYGDNWIRRGTSLALGVRVTPNVHIQFYYNQLALYYAAIGITF